MSILFFITQFDYIHHCNLFVHITTFQSNYSIIYGGEFKLFQQIFSYWIRYQTEIAASLREQHVTKSHLH